MPLFRTIHQMRPQRVSFNVAADCQEMLILLDGKRLEASLIEVTRPRAVPLGVPALSMCQRQPPNEM